MWSADPEVSQSLRCKCNGKKEQAKSGNAAFNESDAMVAELYGMCGTQDKLVKHLGKTHKRIGELVDEQRQTGDSESDKRAEIEVKQAELREDADKTIKELEDLACGINERVHILTLTGDSKSSEIVVIRNAMHEIIKENEKLLKQMAELKTFHEIELAEAHGKRAKRGKRDRDTNGSKPKSKSSNTNKNGEKMMTSPSTPSSKNRVTYWKKKKYYEAKAIQCNKNKGFKPDPDDPGRCLHCHWRHSPDMKIGAPRGHKGHKVSWKPTKRVYLDVKKCKCNNKKIRKIGIISKVSIDYDGDKRALKVILFLRPIRYCSRCDLVIIAPDPTIPGTFIGKNLTTVHTQPPPQYLCAKSTIL